nr:PC3-like endoprotease variant B isoform X2 [Lytechinus pictus]
MSKQGIPAMAVKLVLLAFLCITTVTCLTSSDEEGLYVNEWAVKVAGGERVAREVAADYGFTFDGQVGTLKDTYAFLKKKMSKRSRRAAENHNELLSQDSRVTWVEQQRIIAHAKKRADDVVPPDQTGANWAIPFNDPLFKKQWYLYNDGQEGATPGMDMNLMPAWKLGYTGKGVVVTIVDDGMDQHHPDLKDNFDMYASFDFNNVSNEHSPTPDYNKPARLVRHGTRCAGEVAAAANNSICGVGVAYEASIGGIRILDGGATDRLTSQALQFNNSHIDIYSCCWGPVDDGIRFEMPHTLTKEAFEHGAKTGRNGKGSIFVWAAGNGGNDDDHCGADGYVGDIHTIAISAINDHGRPSYFVESCPAIMAVTLSGGPATVGDLRNGNFRWNLVTTTDLYGNCTTAFVGTSSAAPLASGMFAVVLQANPQLTWRDLQYLITEGSKIPQPYNDGWIINGAGLHVHHDLGFGVLDAGKMVELALTWDLVGPQETCEVDPVFPDLSLRQGDTKNVTVSVNCPSVRSMEHVKSYISLQAYRRGDISLVLYSPFGTPSRLIDTRIHDSHTEGLTDWPFMTVHNWGEDPNGDWTLEFRYNPTPENADQPEDEELELYPRVEVHRATLSMWGMTIYGVSEPRERADVDEAKEATTTVGKEGEGEEEEEDKNPAVNPDDAGKSDWNTIRKIYNQEQLDSEEIHLDLEDIANGVPLPPNRAHNINKITGGIGTEYFDGNLLSNQGLVKLAMFARRLDANDPILRYLNSLDDETLMMLGRDFDLDNVMEDTVMEGREVDVGLEEDVKVQAMAGGEARGISLEEGGSKREGLDDVAIDGRNNELTNTDILHILRSLDVDTLRLLVELVEEMDTSKKIAMTGSLHHQDKYAEKTNQNVLVQYQKKTDDALLGDRELGNIEEKEEEEEEEEEEEKDLVDEVIQFQKRLDADLLGRSSSNTASDMEKKEEEEEIEEKRDDELIQFQKRTEDDLLGSGLRNDFKRKKENDPSEKEADTLLEQSKATNLLEDDRLDELLRDLQDLLEDD